MTGKLSLLIAFRPCVRSIGLWRESGESMYDRLMLLFPVSPSTHAPITSWRGLGHAQAGKPERDPLRFTRDRRLAAQHGLHLPGRRDQLIGLALGDALAGMGLDVADEIGELAARGGRLASIDGREHILEL